MRLQEAVTSAVHLLVVLSYIILGCFATILPSRLDWRITIIRWLDTCPENFYTIAAVCAGIGLFFLFCFYGVGRGRFLRVAMKPHRVAVDMKLLEQTISDYLKTDFPFIKGANVVVTSSKRLEIGLQAEQQMELPQELERGLGTLLRERFGYREPFTLCLCIR